MLNLSLYDILFAIGIVGAAGGFYLSTKERLKAIERDILQQKLNNTDVTDRLARIETKLDLLTSKL